MNIWNVTLACAEWANPWQNVMVATDSIEVEDAIIAARSNFVTGQIIEIKHVGFAHIAKGLQS